MCVSCADLMWRIGTRVPHAIAGRQAIRTASLVPITWNMHAQTIPSAERQCTRQCTPAASDSVFIGINSLKCVTQYYTLYPTPNLLCLTSTHCASDDNNKLIVTLNCAASIQHHVNGMQIAPTHAVADTGAMLVFVMAGAPAKNIRMATKPIHLSLPDRTKISSTHKCDIDIPGLPDTLIGHIVLDMKMASLLGIRVLCKAGCTVIFDDEK
jgi:hypothetical protein